MEDITRRLMESVKDQKPWKDYTTMEINIANEEACFETLKALDEAEADARKKNNLLLMFEGTSISEAERDQWQEDVSIVEGY